MRSVSVKLEQESEFLTWFKFTVQSLLNPIGLQSIVALSQQTTV